MKFQFEPVPPPKSIPADQWNSWIWQVRNSLKSQHDFEKLFKLHPDEIHGFAQNQASNTLSTSKLFKFQTTPYYAHLAINEPHNGPIRRIFMPSSQEYTPGSQALLDPLAEKKNRPCSRIIHRYPDRVLFLPTDICSVYCRYCTRKHFTGKEQAFATKNEYDEALQYIKTHKGIREVILSGGDPLTLSNNKLEQILSDLRSIQHIEIIRIGSRMPVVCPMRIDSELIKIIQKYHPIYMMVHFNHPKEITQEAAQTLTLMANNGIPLFNQMVLLNGINNHETIVQALSRRLLYLRVKPYYMFQCDPSEGTDHLRTSLEDSEKIQQNLWGTLSGLATPQLTVDIPDGGGKVGITPNFEIQKTQKQRFYQGWDKVTGTYINPPPQQHQLPLDYTNYIKEWSNTKNAKK